MPVMKNTHNSFLEMPSGSENCLLSTISTVISVYGPLVNMQSLHFDSKVLIGT